MLESNVSAVGRVRIYVSGVDEFGQANTLTASVGHLQVEYAKPIHLFEVNPSTVMDASGVRLAVWGSDFRNVRSLKCRFESSMRWVDGNGDFTQSPPNGTNGTSGMNETNEMEEGPEQAVDCANASNASNETNETNATNATACGAPRVVGARPPRRPLQWSYAEVPGEFHTPHFMVCPTPEPTSWRRMGGGEVHLRVSVNGQEWSSALPMTFLTPPSLVTVEALGSLPREPPGGFGYGDTEPRGWLAPPGEIALLLHGYNFNAWPDVLCEVRPRGQPSPAALVPSLLLSDRERTCSVPRELRHLAPEDLSLQLLAPDGLTKLLREEIGVPVSPRAGTLWGGTAPETAPQVLGISPDWGWNTGSTLVRVRGRNLPDNLIGRHGELGVFCDFGEAGIVDAVSTSPTLVECETPPFTTATEVPVAVLVGNPTHLRLSHADAKFRYVHRFHVAQITPILGMTSGGTNVSLTLTSQPLPLEDFDLDCAFGTNRVRAALVEVAAVSAGFRSYMLQCKVPAAAEIPRLTKAGCHCKRRWFTTAGKKCDTHCCNLENDPEGARCYVEDPSCQGADWGYCDVDRDILSGVGYPVCVRVLPSSARSVVEWEPCMHRFTYVTTPHADYVTPRAGPIDGGTNVTVHGGYVPQTRRGMLG
jgi:hypothetical protein